MLIDDKSQIEKSERNEVLFDKVCGAYTDMLVKKMSSFQSFSSEYSRFLKSLVTKYISENVDHFILQMSADSTGPEESIGDMVSKDTFSRIRANLRESIQHMASQYRESMDFEIQMNNFNSIDNHGFVVSENTFKSGYIQNSKPNRPSGGTIISEMIPAHQVFKRVGINLTPQHKPRRILESVNCATQLENKTTSWNTGRPTGTKMPSVNHEFLISKPRSRKSTTNTVMHLNTAGEYLDNLVNSICRGHMAEGSSLYEEIGAEYLERLKRELGEARSMQGRSEGLMKLNMVVNQVLTKCFQCSIKQLTSVSTKSKHLENWRNEISMISTPENLRTKLQTMGKNSFISQKTPNPKISPIKYRGNSLGSADEFKEFYFVSTTSKRRNKMTENKWTQGDGRAEKLSTSRQALTQGKDESGKGLVDMNRETRRVAASESFSEAYIVKRKKDLEACQRPKTAFQSERHFNPRNADFEKMLKSSADKKMYSNSKKMKIDFKKKEKNKKIKIFNVSKINKKFDILSENNVESLKLTQNEQNRQGTDQRKKVRPWSKQHSKIDIPFDVARAKTFLENSSNLTQLSGDGFTGRDDSFYFYDLDLVKSNWLEYEGGVKDKLKHGEGVWTLGNGEIFEGTFLYGKANGPGRYISSNHEILEGLWINNKFQYKMEHNVRNSSSRPQPDHSLPAVE